MLIHGKVAMLNSIIEPDFLKWTQLSNQKAVLCNNALTQRLTENDILYRTG